MEKIKNYKNAELVGEDFSNAAMPPLRDDFIAKLENALMFMDYRDLSIWHSEAHSKVHLNNFDGSWLVDVSLRHDKEQGFMFKPFGGMQVTPDMFPKLNIKFMSLGSEGNIASLNKYRFLDTKEKRHLANYKYIYSERQAYLDYGKQKWWTNETGYGFNKMDENMIIPFQTSLKSGYVLNPVDVMNRMREDIKDMDSMYIRNLYSFHTALQLSMTYDYEWSCYIKEKPDSLGVRIPIHPSSSKEVFMMRNIPEGKGRRKAIVNFVKDHYRTIKGHNDNERKVLIQKHFRGELKFNWRGLEVHIIPSPYDLRKTKTTKKFLEI